MTIPLAELLDVLNTYSILCGVGRQKKSAEQEEAEFWEALERR